MGEDFIRKTERSYRRSLQRVTAQRLIVPPLLRPQEDTNTTYPCRLVAPLRQDGQEANLLLHRRDDHTLEILDEHRVIARVEGEPCQDLNEYLDQQPGARTIIRIEPVRVDDTHLDFKIRSENEK